MSPYAKPHHRGEKTKRRLAILILSGDRPTDLDHISALCSEARKRDLQVEIFLMADSVNYLPDHRLQMAKDQGARVSFCALNAMERGIDSLEGYPWGLEESTQYELACMVETSDVFLAFS